MTKWPCTDCLVKMICSKPCIHYLILLPDCLEVTTLANKRRMFVYDKELVEGPFDNTRSSTFMKLKENHVDVFYRN